MSFNTDINAVNAIIEAVATHPGVLSEPNPPDCERRGSGDSGVDFAVGFWVNRVQIPYPQRLVHLKGQPAD